MNADELKANLADQWWRLNNLYWIEDKDAKRVLFKPNWAQTHFYRNMWYLNCILKARQLGFTTFIDIFELDTALFNDNQHIAIIAHRGDDAEQIFRYKIKNVYESLPDVIKARIPLAVERSDELVFANGSSVRASVSFRSGTMQGLHVSEFGKMCRMYPERAREVITGAFNTVKAGNMIFVESTAEGRGGYFYDMCQTAMNLALQKKTLTPMDWKFFFYPWWKCPDYVLHTGDIVVTSEDRKYFADLEKKKIVLTDAQKHWYIAKKNTPGMRDDMKREFPSTPDEAFEATIEGAIFGHEMRRIREDGRITHVPYNPMYPVDTWWDLGRNDDTAIWFTQTVGYQVRVIDYYENSLYGLPHYSEELRRRSAELGYKYGKHLAPHDIMVHDFSNNKTRMDSAKDLGIFFTKTPRVQNKIEGIHASRAMLGSCVFDESKCAAGIESLDAYRWAWDEKHAEFKDYPAHGKESHAADALQTGALGHTFAHDNARGFAKPVKQTGRGVYI